MNEREQEGRSAMNDMMAFSVWKYLHEQAAAELEQTARRERLVAQATARNSEMQTLGERRFRWPVFSRRTAGVRTA